jgi:protein PhnA
LIRALDFAASPHYCRVMSDIIVKDSNGNILNDGDSVTLTKDLKVKGSGGATLKRGTKIKNIRLTDDPAEIECNAPGIKGLVLRTEFLKKA